MEEYPQAESSGEHSKADAQGLDKWLRPISRTLRKRANGHLLPVFPNILSVIVIVISVTTAALHQLYFNQATIDHLDQSKVSGIQPDYIIDLCDSIAQQPPPSIATLERYKRIYHGNIRENCYQEVICKSLIDCLSHENYLREFGQDGLCSSDARKFLRDECNDIPPNDDDPIRIYEDTTCIRQIQDYSCALLLERYFNATLNFPDSCREAAISKLQVCAKEECEKFVLDKDCSTLNAYKNKSVEIKARICYQEIQQQLKQVCEQPVVPPFPPLPSPQPNPEKIGRIWIMKENFGIERPARGQKIKDPYRAAFGLLFSWSKIIETNPCPKDWRLLNKEDVDYLLRYYTTDPFRDLTDPSRANLKMGGMVDAKTKELSEVGQAGYYWTSVTDPQDSKKAFALKIDRQGATLVSLPKEDKISCRCVADTKKLDAADL